MESSQDEERATNLKGLKKCIYVILWLTSAVLYILQLVSGIWLAVIQLLDKDYVMFSIIVAPIVFPMVLLSLISIVWYHDQDKVNKYLQDTHPTDVSFRNLKPLLRVGVTLSHVTGFGILYRYCQLMISIARNSKSCDILSLQRDSLLLQFLVGFLSNAPLIMVHIYQLLPDMASGQFEWVWPTFLVPFSSLVVAILSLLLTIFTYIANDRLHSETRRIVYPGHVTAFIWHASMVAGRIMTLALFGIAFGPYVSIVIAVHWISTVVWGLFEKTNICGDVTRTPPKKRLYFEFPFVIVISFVFLFVYFNIRDGSTKIRIIIYHVLTAIETLVLNALFFAVRPDFPLSIWLFAITVSLYIVGVAFMVLYYTAYHPNRTNDCFKLGIPYACDCCHVFHKIPTSEIANVDLPWDNENGNSESNGVALQLYNPLANLSTLTEQQPAFTIGQVSRSLTTTPTGTPQHQAGGVSSFVRQGSGRVSTTSRHNPTNDQTNVSRRTTRQYKSGTRPGLGMEYQSSTPNITYQPRPVSVSMEMRPFTPSMRCRSFSEDVGMSSTNTSGIGQLSMVKRPASESIDASHSIFNQSTPVHHRPRYNNGRRSRHSGPVGHYLPDRTSELINNEATPNGRNTPVTRQDNFNPLLTTGGSQMYGNYSGMIALPSPIGEEPMEGVGLPANRFDIVSPVVVQVNGISYSNGSKTQNGHNSIPEPVYATPFDRGNHHITNRQKDANYTDFTPTRKVIRSMYVDTPTHTPLSRRRSLSPVPAISKSNGHTSPNFKSTNCTPRASPFPGRRHRNPSNPLHSHDPMKEFTQLYSTKHNGMGTTPAGSSNRISNPATGELRVPSSSSCAISSDNQTDSDEETIRNTSLNAKSSVHHSPTTSIHRPPTTSTITNGTTLQIPVTMGSSNGTQKVTAHRQNSEEFLITKLHNVTGTLV